MATALIAASIACQGNSIASSTSSAPVLPAENDSTNSGSAGAIPVDLPERRENHAGDQDSSENAARKLVSGGEKFVSGLYERPFNADPMDIYFSYLDIIETQGFMDDRWGFATITLVGTDANGRLSGNYGVELDLDRDGRGEWLILASNPIAAEWTTQGVQVWNDANQDLGGAIAMVADEDPPGDGYETLVFTGGADAGPAWVRLSGADSRTVEIAFELAMLGNAESFAMGSWAGSGQLDPSLFDMNDHMTHIEAGSPLPDYYVYPLKQLSEIDNTCRMAIGFVPNGEEPGLCETIRKDLSGSVPKAGCTPPAAGIMNPCP
jgi:hypothetical protein